MKLKVKDSSALTYLYDSYGAAIYGAVFRIVGEQEITEEVVQDVFLKIWDRIELFDAQKGRLFTWMLNIARHSAIDKIRSKEIKRSAKTDSIEGIVHTIDKQKKTETPIDRIGVRELLEQLDANQQFVLQKVYFEGYSHSEVADDFAIPLGTVKSRIRSALKNLRRGLIN